MKFDVVVVGGGIAGASVAYQLACDRSVALLERESQPGYHSTGRSAAMFMETYGTPAIRALTCASRVFYERPPPGFTEHPILTPRGAMFVARVGEEDELAAAFEVARVTSPGVQILQARQAVEVCPVLREDLLCGALYEPDAMDIDVHALHQGYLRGFRARGGKVFQDSAFESGVHRSGQWTVQLADGRILAAPALVNAAGAWADDVARRSGADAVGLQPRRRTAFTFAGPEGLDIGHWPAVLGLDEGWYFKPDAGQLLGSPANADPVDPHDVQPEELDVATGIWRIEEVTTMHIRRPKHMWAGLRSFVADGDLVVGPDTVAAGFFWVAAQGGYGIQTAAAVSELAASQLRGQGVPGHLARFGVRAADLSPTRLPRAGTKP